MEEKNGTSLRLEIVENMTALASAGLGLVAALAWNDAIQGLFKEIFGTASGLIVKFLYAALITIVVVLVTTRLSRVADKLKKTMAEGSETPDTH